jgi:hypothetical protein
MRFFTLFILGNLCLLLSCKQDDIPQPLPYQRLYYLQALLRPYDKTIFDTIVYEIGKPILPDQGNLPIFFSSTGVIGNHKVLSADVYLITNTPYAQFIFTQKETLAAGAPSSWSEAEIRALFKTGDTFTLDGTPGNAEILWDICDPSIYCGGFYSKSSKAMQQTGQIEIVEVAEQETFQVLTFTGTIPSRGLRVKIRFSGRMATYLPPFDFPTYAGDSELVAGEASLYVAF